MLAVGARGVGRRMATDEGSRGREGAHGGGLVEAPERAAAAPPGSSPGPETLIESSLEYSFGGAVAPSPVTTGGRLALPPMVGPAPPSRPEDDLAPGTPATLPRLAGSLALAPESVDTLPPPRRSSGFASGEAPTQKTCFAPEEVALTLEHVGRYVRLEGLDTGGDGRGRVVFDRHLEREVAIEELQPDFMGTAAEPGAGGSRVPAEKRFVHEARVTGQLEHPGVVPVHELGRRHDGTLYFTLQRARGRPLGEALEGRDLAGRLELVPQLLAVCHAVGFAHARGVVHRDLQPDCVMIGDFGEAVVLDWGLAKRRDGADVQGAALAARLEHLRGDPGRPPVPGVRVGGPAYLSPEQARGEVGAIDERSDVYSLGAILFELMVGAPPFTGGDAREILRKILEDPTPAALEREPRCPRELDAIVGRALAKDPGARYPDARALAADLGAFLTGRLMSAHRSGWVGLGWRWRRRYVVALGVAAVLLAVGVGVWWYWGVTRERAAAAAAAARSDLDRGLAADPAGAVARRRETVEPPAP